MLLGAYEVSKNDFEILEGENLEEGLFLKASLFAKKEDFIS